MKKITLFLIAGALATTAVKAQAPDPDTTAKHFLIMASIGNLQEINAGVFAAQKATTADIKAFGQQMVKDHSDSEAKLLQLAKMKNYNLPSAATEKPPMDMMLENINGKDFDRVYVHMMVPGHDNTVSMFQNYAITGKDPDVRAFAQKTLPTIKMHLAAIKAIDEKIKDQKAK
jgi:putative membrane protein